MIYPFFYAFTALSKYLNHKKAYEAYIHQKADIPQS